MVQFGILHPTPPCENDVTAHSKRNKHLEILSSKVTTPSVSQLFEKQTNENLLIAAKEATFVYQMVQHNHSFRSMKCTSEIVRVVCDQKGFSCSETKASAIVSGVFEPMILAQIRSELEEAYFLSISTDFSSHKEIKMFPVIIRFFSPTEGIKTRLIEFTNLTEDDGEHIFGMLKEMWQKWGFGHKIIIIARDICELFEEAIIMIEGNDICGYEAIKIVQNLQIKLQGCIEQQFMSIEAEQELSRLAQQGQEFEQATVFDDIMLPIYVGCLDYLNEWLQHTLFLNEFEWVTLAKGPEWDDIDKISRNLIDKGFFKVESHQQLFHVYTFLKAFMTDAKINEFNDMKTPIAERWTDFF